MRAAGSLARLEPAAKHDHLEIPGSLAQRQLRIRDMMARNPRIADGIPGPDRLDARLI
jgi:hypothetical protein